MFKPDHTIRDNCLYLKEVAENRIAKEKQETEKAKKEREDFFVALNNYRTQAELKDSEISRFSESVINDHLETVFEAIYISALEKVSPLSEQEVNMAQNLVKNYIQEHGGASAIMSRNSGKTYLLDFMFECAKTAHDIDMKIYLEADDEEKELEDAKKKVKEDEKKDNSDADENESGEDLKLGDANGDGKDDSESDEVKKDPKEDRDLVDDLEDDSESDEEEKEEKESDKEEKSKDEDENENYKEKEDRDLVDDLEDDSESKSDETPEEFKDEEKSNNNTDTDEGFKAALEDEDTLPDEGAEEEESNIDNEGKVKDSKEDMFEKLENDETVDNAVDIIAKRIADAEAEFIKRNAEDKAKIEKIADKIDERIQAVNQSDKSEEEKDKEKQELKIEAAREMNETKHDRFRIVFEEMISNNANYIVKDKALLESYSGNDGKVDFTKIVDVTRVQYGFLEFLNTVQLEKVDKQYILDVVNERK